MRLGIDFGTNRTVVAAADRGNYPLVSFEAADGTTPDWYPSLIAIRGNEYRFGWDAWALQTGDSWTIVRSIKRLLEDSGPETLLELDSSRHRVVDLLNGFAAALCRDLRENSNLRVKSGDALEAMLGVPAHANSNQRFLTVSAFGSAGFQVLGILNEPSAASIEFGHRQRSGKSPRESLLVYDLGGGTFDASLVTLDENVHHVIASAGIPTIGGDDFDHILADLALEAADLSLEERDELSASQWFHLLEECRAKKEALNPNSRRVSIDLEQVNDRWGVVHIPVADFYESARPLVEETIAAAEDLLKEEGEECQVLYITGGGSELPLVARILRERFGRRVSRSAYARSATAIGLAIQAGNPDAYKLSDRLARYFGVWREAEHGSRIVFDPLFAKGALLPAAGEEPLSLRREYTPVHNIGHFRFLECTHQTEDGTPTGEVTLWDEIHFPFDLAVSGLAGLSSVTVTFSENALQQRIEELYECDSNGSIKVTIANLSSGERRSYPLGHWAGANKQSTTSRGAKTRAKRSTASISG